MLRLTRATTQAGKRENFGGHPEKPVRGIFPCSSSAHHLVWGRVVPDIPDFCRELIHLPPCSPGLNPIEDADSKIRELDARTKGA